jgi:hypothetical protein
MTIYLQVGYERDFEGFPKKDEIEDYSSWYDKEIKIYPRKLIKVKDSRKKTIILAVYENKEIHPYDMKVIKRHRTFKAVLENEKEIHYFSFTHYHFLETLRKRKISRMKTNGLLENDDNTVFGRVEKIIIIPEERIVAPERKETIYVEWDDWDDEYQSYDDDYRNIQIYGGDSNG